MSQSSDFKVPRTRAEVEALLSIKRDQIRLLQHNLDRFAEVSPVKGTRDFEIQSSWVHDHEERIAVLNAEIAVLEEILVLGFEARA